MDKEVVVLMYNGMPNPTLSPRYLKLRCLFLHSDPQPTSHVLDGRPYSVLPPIACCASSITALNTL